MAAKLSAVYQELLARWGKCPIEAGVLGALADHECEHGRLPGDRTPPCGCWSEALVVKLPVREQPDEEADAAA